MSTLTINSSYFYKVIYLFFKYKKGDSGAAHFANVNGRAVQIGITSFGFQESFERPTKRMAGVVLRVSSFVKWIRKSVGEGRGRILRKDENGIKMYTNDF